MSDQSITRFESQEQGIALRPEQNQEMQRFLPVMSMEVAVQRRQIVVQAIKTLMKDGEDYGVIPGTSKPTLYQPGADKLNNLFGLVPQFAPTKETEDWTGTAHGGESLFFYEVKCYLKRGDFVMGEGDGSCNSWESKYRWRKTERVCPECGKDAIIRGKKEYGGGWLCFAKKGGCGAKFKTGDAAIEEQETGRVHNPDVFDLVNTVKKIANKRAKIAATLNATSAHEFFHQDLEDIPQLQDQEYGQEPPQQGTQAAADGVAARKLAEAVTRFEEQQAVGRQALRPTPATPSAQPEPAARPAPTAPKSTAPWITFSGMLNCFTAQKERLKSYDTPYYDLLRKYGVQPAKDGKPHANSFKTAEIQTPYTSRSQMAEACYHDLVAIADEYERLKAELAAAPVEEEPGGFQATDSDLPEILQGGMN